MPSHLSALDGAVFLMEPGRLRRTAVAVAKVPTCPTGRELVAERRKRLDFAAQASGRTQGPPGRKVGVIPVYGPVEQRLTAALDKAGGTSLEEVSSMLDVLLDDPSVGSIVLHWDSPGGSSFGVQELSERVAAARGRKTIISMCDSLMCSAAYWIGSAAGTVVMTPGGDAGSIGVYTMHVDESKALEDDGIKVTMVSAGEHKTELASVQPLTDAAKAYLQDSVNDTYRKFVAGVASNRRVSEGKVLAEFGQGRTLNAEQALAVKMVDRIATFDQLLAELLQGGSGGGSRQQSASMAMVLEFERDKRKRQLAMS